MTPGEDPGKEFRLRLEGVGERLSLWGWRNDLHDLKDDDLAALFFALEDLVEGFLGGSHQSNGDDSFLGTPMGASFLSLLRWRVGFTVNPLEDMPQHWLSLGFQPVPRAMVAALSDELLRDGASLISPALWEGLLVKLKRPPLFSARERAAFSENLKPLAQGLRELEAEGVSELPPGLVESFVGSLLQRHMRELQQAAQAAR